MNFKIIKYDDENLDFNAFILGKLPYHIKENIDLKIVSEKSINVEKINFISCRKNANSETEEIIVKVHQIRSISSDAVDNDYPYKYEYSLLVDSLELITKHCTRHLLQSEHFIWDEQFKEDVFFFVDFSLFHYLRTSNHFDKFNWESISSSRKIRLLIEHEINNAKFKKLRILEVIDSTRMHYLVVSLTPVSSHDTSELIIESSKQLVDALCCTLGVYLKEPFRIHRIFYRKSAGLCHNIWLYYWQENLIKYKEFPENSEMIYIESEIKNILEVSQSLLIQSEKIKLICLFFNILPAKNNYSGFYKLFEAIYSYLKISKKFDKNAKDKIISALKNTLEECIIEDNLKKDILQRIEQGFGFVKFKDKVKEIIKNFDITASFFFLSIKDDCPIEYKATLELVVIEYLIGKLYNFRISESHFKSDDEFGVDDNIKIAISLVWTDTCQEILSKCIGLDKHSSELKRCGIGYFLMDNILKSNDFLDFLQKYNFKIAL